MPSKLNIVLEARQLMTRPGVGTKVFLGDPRRFADAKALASYVGIIPREYSGGEDQRSVESPSKGVRCCGFSGVKQAPMQLACRAIGRTFRTEGLSGYLTTWVKMPMHDEFSPGEERLKRALLAKIASFHGEDQTEALTLETAGA